MQYLQYELSFEYNICMLINMKAFCKLIVLFLMSSYIRIPKSYRPGLERCVITLAHVHTYHIKNTHVACCTPKTVHGVLLHLFLIHSFSTLLITLFTIVFIKESVCLYSTFIYFSSYIKLHSVFHVLW